MRKQELLCTFLPAMFSELRTNKIQVINPLPSTLRPKPYILHSHPGLLRPHTHFSSLDPELPLAIITIVCTSRCRCSRVPPRGPLLLFCDSHVILRNPKPGNLVLGGLLPLHLGTPLRLHLDVAPKQPKPSPPGTEPSWSPRRACSRCAARSP